MEGWGGSGKEGEEMRGRGRQEGGSCGERGEEQPVMMPLDSCKGFAAPIAERCGQMGKALAASVTWVEARRMH